MKKKQKKSEKEQELNQEKPEKQKGNNQDLKEYTCPNCDYSNTNFTSVDRHSRKKHSIALELDNEDNILICETKPLPRSKMQKKEKSDEKVSEDPYIKSLEIEKNRLARENSLLSEQLNQQRLRERGAELPYGYKSPRDYDRNERVLSDISLSDYLDTKTQKLKWGDENHPKSSNDNIELIVSMQEEMADLKKELSTQKEKRNEEMLKDMSNKISELSKNQIQASNAFGCVDTGLKEISGLAKEYLELGKIAMGFSKTAPKREKVGDNGSFPYNMLPDDMVSEE